MSDQGSARPILNAIDIPYVTAEQAYILLQEELKRFLGLMEALGSEDWGKPTACTAWNVRDILAHQTGGYASGTGYRELIRQYSTKRKPGQLPEDAINDLQINERQGRSPSDLIAELRVVGPLAVQKWAHQFRLAKVATRLINAPHPVAGTISFEHLMWVIHSRDTWMHRLDICRATNRHFEQTREHDGRIAALVMLDVARSLSPHLKNGAILFELSGIAGGTWKVGSGEVLSTVSMDVLDFNIFASGRFNHDEALSRASLSGAVEFATAALKQLLILY